MGEESWVQRQPGSASGSVVPPAVPEVGPPLPKRAARRGLDQQPDQSPQRSAPEQSDGRVSAQQPLPDSLRAFFKPVWTPDQTATGAPSSAQDVAPGANGSGAPVSPDRRTAAGWSARRARQAGQPPRNDRGGTRRQIARLVAVVIVMLAASGTALALARQHGGSRARGADPTGPGGRSVDGLSDATAVRSRTGAWIAREISRSSIVACDAVMCAVLYRDGLPASNLLVLGPSAPDPLGADVVVATPVLRNQFGKSLRSVYAPTVLASFGSGPDRVDVLAVAPDGAAAYDSALAADLAARKVAGSQLISNDRIALSATARAELVAGRIDPRLLIMLPAMAEMHPIQVVGFGDRAPGASPAVPLTSVVLSATDRQSGLSGHGYLGWLLRFLRGQQLPYRATTITMPHRGGRSTVIVRFARPSPLGLLVLG